MTRIKDPRQTPRLVRSSTGGAKLYVCASLCDARDCPHYKQHRVVTYVGAGGAKNCTETMLCKRTGLVVDCGQLT